VETVQVEIFGQMYTLKGGEDANRVRELADYVNVKMRDIQKGTGVSEGYRVAILAALNIADELHRIKVQQQSLQRIASQSAERLLELTGGPGNAGR